MSRRQEFFAGLMVCGALALTGCAGGDDGAPSETSASVVVVTDATTCTVFGDVLTIVANADVAVSEGRMEAQEQRGWYGLATRMLDRVPTRGEGAVSDALDALKKLAPATAAGAAGTPGFGSSEWVRAEQGLGSACADGGTELTVEGFTGG